MKWLCKVPLTLTEAQLLVSKTEDSKFIESELEGYSFVATTNNYGGIKQRWLIVKSQERKESDLRKLSQKIIKAGEKAQSDLNKLSKEEFGRC
jgi:transposase